MWLADDDWPVPGSSRHVHGSRPINSDHVLVVRGHATSVSGETVFWEKPVNLLAIDLPERVSPTLNRTVTLNGCLSTV